MNQSVLNRSRNDKFAFVLDLPLALKKQTDLVMSKAYNANQIQLTTFGSPVPSIRVSEIKVPFGGQVYNASSLSRPSYEALSLKFLIDNTYQNYWMLWKWLNLFNDTENSTTELTKIIPRANGEIGIDNPMSDFTTTFSLFSLDEFNNKIDYIANKFQHKDGISLIISDSMIRIFPDRSLMKILSSKTSIAHGFSRFVATISTN